MGSAGAGTASTGPGISIRARLLIAILALVIGSATLTGLTVYALERARAERHAMETLSLEAADFAQLAASVVPGTGAPRFGDATELLRAYLEGRSLTAADGVLGIADGRVRWLGADGVPVRPETDPAFVAQALDLTRAGRISLGRYAGSDREFAYLVAPVRFAASGTTGALVRVVDLRVAFGHLDQIFRTFWLTVIGSVLLVGAAMTLITTYLLQPLTWVRNTAEQIGEDDLSRRIPVRGDDDLSALTRTVNGMLDRLERAHAGQRRLLDDVGHELRTPLTVVRGHLSMMNPADPGDVSATRALTLDELDRMSRLVEDLLTLATSERDDFVVPEPVDVVRLTDDAFDKARMLGERDWRIEELADVEVRLDPGRIVQAWLQLASNAVKYSAPGSRVGLGSRLEGDELRLWVRDEGIGIETGDRELVLTRFGRSSRAASRTESPGLGLAIVDSIAKAHGGRVDIDSAPGVGSTVALVLPAAGARPTPGDAGDDAAPDDGEVGP